MGISLVMIKKLLNKILGYFNLKIINKRFTGTIDKRELTPFDEKNNDFKLYFEGLKKSENTKTDNFFNPSK